MRFSVLSLILLLSPLLVSLPVYSQEEEDLPQNEDEIWNTGRTKKKKAESPVHDEKEVEEYIPPGAFEYADEEDMQERKKATGKKDEKRQADEMIVKEKEGKKGGESANVIPPDAGAPHPDAGTATDSRDLSQNLSSEITTLKVPEARIEEIERLWFERLQDLKLREVSKAEERLKKIIEYKLDSGIPDIPHISLALALESRRAIKANDFVTGGRLAGAALMLAPDIYEIWFYNAYISWISNKTDIFRPLKFMIEGLKRTFLPIATGPLVLGNIITLLSLIIATFALLLIIALLLQHANRILHDLSHLFPTGRSQFLSDTIWLSIFLMLITRFSSVFHFILIGGVVLWIYLVKKERFLLVLTVLAVSTLPYNFDIYNRLLYLYQDDMQSTYRAYKFEESCKIEELYRKIDSGAASTDDYLAAGIINKRRGNFELAERMYKKAIELNASNTAAYNNLGNLYLIQERHDDALVQYNNALNLEPRSEKIRYNISRLFLRKKELDKSSSELSVAKRFNEEYITEILKSSTPNINRFVVDMEPSFNIDLSLISEQTGGKMKRMYLPFEHYITGGIMPSDVLFWLIVVTVLGVILSLISRNIQTSHICHRCGRPVCRTCSPEIYSDEECAQCFHIFTRRDVSDPKTRFIKEKEISSYQFFRNLITRLVSIVIPGSSHIWSGRTMRGAVILFLSVVGFISLFFFNRPNPLPYFSTTAFETIFNAPFVIAGLLAYMMNIRDAFRKG